MSNAPRGLPLSSSRLEQIFPKLTLAQISGIALHGHTRTILYGEVLVEQGDSTVPFLCWSQVKSRLYGFGFS